MSFKLRKGRTRIEWLPVTTSTALSADSLVIFTSGLLVAATSSSAASAIVGVLIKAIASTDSDYATARVVPVRIPVEKNVIWEATSASAVATDIGLIADLTDASTVNRGASSNNIIRITEVPSATLVRGVLIIAG